MHNIAETMSAPPPVKEPRVYGFLLKIDRGFAAIVIGFLLFFAAFVAIGTYRPLFQYVQSSDPSGYYAWVRSPIFDGDFQFANEYRTLNRNVNTQLLEWANPDMPRTSTGHIPNYFAIGSGILWAPFILAVDPLAEALGGKRDGFSPPYHMAVFHAIAFYGLAGAVALYYGLKKWFSAGISAFAAFVAWASSPMLFYTFPDIALSHSCSMFAMCVFFLAWVRLREDGGAAAWFVIGLALGLAALVRWQNVTYTVIPAMDLLWRLRMRGVSRLFWCGIGTAIAFTPQMIGWWIVFGTPLTMPQGHDFMHWTQPDFGGLFFSRSYGLLTWTPFCGVAIVGLAMSPLRYRFPILLLFIALLIQFYVNACLYEAGWSFGSRRLDNAIPIFGVGIAAMSAWIARRSSRRLWYTFAAFAVVWNFLSALQFAGLIDGFYIERAYQRLADRYKVPVESLYDAHTLPDGQPFNPALFESKNIFPRWGDVTLEQFTVDKLLVVKMASHKLFGTPAPTPH